MTATDETEPEELPAEAAGIVEKFKIFRKRFKTFRERDKEITRAWRKRARNRKIYRILWMFGIFAIITIVTLPVLNSINTPTPKTPLDDYGPYQISTWMLDVTTKLGFGAMMAFTIFFIAYAYKQIVSEICLIIPGFSFFLFIALSWLHIKWIHVITEAMRHSVPDNLVGIYEVVSRFVVPVIFVYLSFVSYFVSFLTWAIRIQLHRGFLKYGDGFREKDYYREFTSTDVEPFPPLRVQIAKFGEALLRRRQSGEPPNDEDEIKVIASTMETLRSVFPKGF